MILPIIDTPTYNVTLPISKRSIRIRPYNVKEKKLLTMALAANDQNYLIDTIKQVYTNCIVSSDDVSDISVVDSEYLFYNLRARSESEIVKLKYRCEKRIGDSACGSVMDIDFNLLTDLIITEGLDPTIQLSDTVGVVLKYEKMSHITTTDDIPSIDDQFAAVARNIESIYDGDAIYSASDISPDKMINFLEMLPPNQYIKIDDFFANAPSITRKVDVVCQKCGTLHNVIVEDIFSFLV